LGVRQHSYSLHEGTWRKQPWGGTSSLFLWLQSALEYGSVNVVVGTAQLKFTNVRTKLYRAHTTYLNTIMPSPGVLFHVISTYSITK
jgi:hypothetical protein